MFLVGYFISKSTLRRLVKKCLVGRKLSYQLLREQILFRELCESWQWYKELFALKTSQTKKSQSRPSNVNYDVAKKETSLT